MLLASRLVSRGEWTTYGDLGAGATGGGRAARLVARLAASHPEFANAHRVLGAGGQVVGEEAGAQRRRARLEAEGVAFRGRRADPARRVRWVELRGRLAEQDPAGHEQRVRSGAQLSGVDFAEVVRPGGEEPAAAPHEEDLP